ncbi:Bifunctional protein aas,2-acyl-glycerophospho-ethanolamine acyltransferase,Uncharacterized protein conserved in bacteria,1-acylglycerol-3-phosphate O-acyltransferases,Acyltransferase [Chlamydia serpentis]|uniref:Bifunctional protein aas,2-acyl-glycerophospho-ethanolamine acyltransferase,Uncharacterized protein conserved in bacteria,1-acylglycerol-3-phosphate O-acyltransferases,Acyltransferase n=1 Tax=Chlamydia serpentis TaxID=1967782 RepID=A0A2R8FB93_9CHLA|nr:lysophospholipid acyltransferase family protein [Chlamydia serpentis]SPN73688.1 Bifunctional protein aas,2-acyl-glycerophospho-ethanolamine acyltransferase,Uncharacterized protein conserved in bacteria,1-acylglycerol-3-phosphate O-acyltransferases,Acyltransferase [Chlamydia serpentis]
MIFRICKFFTWVLFSLFYKLKVYGTKKNFIKGPAIIAVNHNSFLDPIALHMCVHECIYHLARASLFNIPWLWKQWGCFPVRTEEGNAAAFKIAVQLFKDGKKLVIYPEGARSPNGQLQPGKIGIGMMAMKSKIPVIPVYIGGTFEAFNRHQNLPNVWKTITCIFGTPMHFDDIIQNPKIKNKEAYQIITNQIMDKIAELKVWYESGCKGEVP